MTRAMLLQLLARPGALSEVDVRALEQLAAAFPYCQTAHLLLAKAAHDQGSMLASQHLRRAATYAVDRACLRQLIELPAAAEIAQVAGAAGVWESAAAPLVALAGAAAPGNEQEYAPELLPTGTCFENGWVEPRILAINTRIEEGLSTDVQSSELLLDLPEQALAPPPATSSPVTDLKSTLPAQAPPIRPPAGAAAQAEFGLAEASPVELMLYRLPELSEPGASATRPARPALVAFGGGAGVGYGLPEGSRLGYCLVAAADENSADYLPPPGAFFAPDALLLEHLVPAPLAAPTPKTSSLHLIESFLRRAPAVTRRRAPAPPDAEAQADLSVRSTRPEPDLASEGLAKILARQGKTDRAIAIYERLMVKHPEKMAYFAAQIDSLRPLA